MLNVTVFNFDPEFSWSSIAWYGDNGELVNGEWENQTIPMFVSAGSGLTPPGFDPAAELTCVVNYMSVAIRNQSQFLQGLGAALTISRGDDSKGLAIKYVIHRFKSNQLGIETISDEPDNYKLEDFYKDDSTWASSNQTSKNMAGLTMLAYSPSLDGASDNTYEYSLSIGLPSVT